MERIKGPTFKDIPISAAIMAITRQTPNITFNNVNYLSEFSFERDDRISQIALDFASGQLMVNASEYEKARSFLFRKTRTSRGGAV